MNTSINNKLPFDKSILEVNPSDLDPKYDSDHLQYDLTNIKHRFGGIVGVLIPIINLNKLEIILGLSLSINTIEYSYQGNSVSQPQFMSDTYLYHTKSDVSYKGIEYRIKVPISILQHKQLNDRITLQYGLGIYGGKGIEEDGTKTYARNFGTTEFQFQEFDGHFSHDALFRC